jgi:hypothetical protein
MTHFGHSSFFIAACQLFGMQLLHAPQNIGLPLCDLMTPAEPKRWPIGFVYPKEK